MFIWINGVNFYRRPVSLRISQTQSGVVRTKIYMWKMNEKYKHLNLENMLAQYWLHNYIGYINAFAVWHPISFIFQLLIIITFLFTLLYPTLSISLSLSLSSYSLSLFSWSLSLSLSGVAFNKLEWIYLRGARPLRGWTLRRNWGQEIDGGHRRHICTAMAEN